MTYENEIKNLTMTPEMWGELNRVLTSDEYRKVVNDYQHREWEQLPTCKTLFGVCRYWSGGKCGKHEYCKMQTTH